MEPADSVCKRLIDSLHRSRIAGWATRGAAALLLTAGLYGGRASAQAPQVPLFSRLELGPAGAARIGGNAGDVLSAMHSADVPAAVHAVADSLAGARGTPQRCNRFFAHESRLVVWLSKYCAVVPGGRDYGGQSMFAITREGQLVGSELRWLTSNDIRVELPR